MKFATRKKPICVVGDPCMVVCMTVWFAVDQLGNDSCGLFHVHHQGILYASSFASNSNVVVKGGIFPRLCGFPWNRN